MEGNLAFSLQYKLLSSGEETCLESKNGQRLKYTFVGGCQKYNQFL
jgi:hypothetical protein